NRRPLPYHGSALPTELSGRARRGRRDTVTVASAGAPTTWAKRAPRAASRDERQLALLRADHRRVAAAQPQEPLVADELRDRAILEHRDLLGVAHGRETVGDRECRSSFGQLVE